MGIVLLLAQFALCTSAAVPPEPVPVILDTDIGSDIDDTWALAMMLGSPQIDLKLITTAFRDTPTKTRLVAKLLERWHRTDVPIGTGVKTADGGINQLDWLGEYDIKSYPGVVYEDGVQALIDTIKKSDREITLVVLGPQGNLREALKRDPSIAENARVVTMAGSVHIGYQGHEGRQPEWNVKADIEAARAVFQAPWEIVMNPLDLCGNLRLAGEPYLRVADCAAPRAQAVIENYTAWTNRDNHPQNASSILFDTVSVYMAVDTSLCRMETVRLSIDDAGNTVPDENGRPVQCALGWKTPEAEDHYKELLIRALTNPLGARYP
ncbi:MAG TPA: nucleoside hydrolase [Candidatus Hydrogenedentes bacterium]|jgi:inosine-uridine nucleoside N-ribohydrolase|nr:nucleoside hydrolase [FCB group bacterium]HNZ17249.1 nucleoside hydrolase [Candidatus Hydrogenedentota bacterium]HPA02893.1 nucleoside hydrolase [Candidatus Hydrogenedentota bacterium]